VVIHEPTPVITPTATVEVTPLAGWEVREYDYSNDHPHAVESLSTGEEYTYDANGNMLTRVENGIEWSMTYSIENRLASMTDGDSVWVYTYDGDGNLVKQVASNGTETHFLLGGAYEVSGNTTRTYYSIAGQMVGMRAGSTLTYLLTDHLGSVVAITDAAGALVEESRYLPYACPRTVGGGARPELGALSGTDKAYMKSPSKASGTGQRDVTDTGLMDYKARMYSSYLGRFIQPDTVIPGVGNPQSWNRYAYVMNNPIKYSDPSGHIPCIDRDENGQCVKDPDWHSPNPGNSSPPDPHKKNKRPENIYMRGYTETEFLNAWQHQGETPYCGPYSVAILIYLLTGKFVSGMEINDFLVQNRFKLDGVGIPGNSLAAGANLLNNGLNFEYSNGNNIDTLIYNVDIGRPTIVGVSWQTNREIGTQLNTNLNLENILNGVPSNDKITVGHWMVLAGYNKKEGNFIFINPGDLNSKTTYTFTEFNEYWNMQPNLFIGSGDMISVYP
jgi:RHS repeat-associated protein